MKFLIWGELLLVAALIIALTYFPSLLEWWEKGAEGDNKYLFPQPLDAGWGGRSFISVATGLNLALVKLETWLKSLADIRERWNSEIKGRIDPVVHYLADDDVFRNVIGVKCHGYRDTAEKWNTRAWAVSRHWAIVLTVAGFGFLFVQYSAGLLALLLLVPGILTASARCGMEFWLYLKVASCVELLSDAKKEIDRQDSNRKSTIADVLSTGPQEAQSQLKLKD